MSTQKTLVLTRPEASSVYVLDQVQAAMGGPVLSVTSPVMKIVRCDTAPDLSNAHGVIVTSAHAVQGQLNGLPAYCVGQRTADAVQAAGGIVKHCAADADALQNWITAQADLGALVYLRGSHVSTDMQGALTAAGLRCTELQTYRQEQIPLTVSAIRALEGEDPAILPLFSARSARLVGRAIAQPGRNLHVIAISDGVAEAWRETTGGASEVSIAATGNAMIGGIVAALQR